MPLTNIQYDRIFRQYEERQKENRLETERRHACVYESIPEFQKLENAVASLAVAQGKKLLSGDEKALDALRKSLADLKAQKEQLLLDAGFSVNFLDPVFCCPDCQDTGYIGDRKCHCFERAIVDFLYSQSNLQDILERENFEYFDLSLYPDDYIEETTGQTPRDNMRNILQTAMEFVRCFPEEPANLLLYGNTGVGKTFLTNCIARELLEQSHTVVYLTSLKLFDILETYKFDRDLSHTEKNAAVSYILDSDLLIIDDLGTELNNSFTSSQLYHCIDARLNHRRATIISTNLSFDDLRERYSERIFSRLTSSYILLKLTGDDIRLRKAIAQQ